MAEMSRLERTFCQSPPWRAFAGRVVLPWALQAVPLSGRVLEIGCGSGAMAARILERFPDVELTATDYDAEMVAGAAERLGRFGERATVEQADATALSYADGEFDAVVSFIMLHHVMDWRPALGEAARVLRPGGVLVGYDIAASAPTRWLHAVQRETHRLVSRPEIETALGELPLEDVRVRRFGGGFGFRFRARRAGET